MCVLVRDSRWPFLPSPPRCPSPAAPPTCPTRLSLPFPVCCWSPQWWCCLSSPLSAPYLPPRRLIIVSLPVLAVRVSSLPSACPPRPSSSPLLINTSLSCILVITAALEGLPVLSNTYLPTTTASIRGWKDYICACRHQPSSDRGECSFSTWRIAIKATAAGILIRQDNWRLCNSCGIPFSLQLHTSPKITSSSCS